MARFVVLLNRLAESTLLVSAADVKPCPCAEDVNSCMVLCLNREQNVILKLYSMLISPGVIVLA